MVRWLLAMAMLVGATCLPLTTAAQDHSPQVGGSGRPVQVDLASLTLTPEDVASLGLNGFGLAAQSSLRDATDESELESGGDPELAEELLTVFRADGFRYRYLGSLLRPRLPLQRLPNGFVAAEQRLDTSVAEFATARGAESDFAFTEGEFDERRSNDIAGDVIGDQSELTRSTGKEAVTQSRVQRLELTFRVDNYIGEVSIIDFDDVEPEVATVQHLATLLLAKIERARQAPGPGLSSSALRVTPQAPWVEGGRLRDFYVRQEQRRDITFAQLVDQIQQTGSLEGIPPASDTEGAFSPQDTYMFWTPIGAGDAFDLPLYVTWIDLYDSPDTAKSALRAIRSTDLGRGYVNIRNFTNTDEQLGEEWRTFGYVYQGGPQELVRGYVMIARLGNKIVRVQADGPAGVNRAGVAALTRLQLACLQTSDACVPVNVDWVSSALTPRQPLLGTPLPTG